MNIFLTNNLTNKKEQFIPRDKNEIGMYVCGPTVYDDPHIGNARPLVIFDILYRLLKSKFSVVTYVRNITDIDDKIIKASSEQKISAQELTEKVTKGFLDDCKFLNCDNPTHQPKATEHISLMIDMINSLIKKDFAYENNKHVYFEVKKFSDYGKLSNKKLDDLIAGSRVEISDNKKNSEDFVLWKPSNDGEPSWESPWGKGRPGWHLECSAMSKKFLGDEFDIHGGGIDLIFPHHENEIAQSRCANSKKIFANYWIHNAFITMSNEKMAKSQGNILKIKDFKNKMSGQIIRLALMSAHYRQPLDWNDKLLIQCENTLNKWYRIYSTNIKSVKIPEEILKPLYDDLNTPGYIANLHSLYENANKGENKELFIAACQFIGLLNENKEQWQDYKKNRVSIGKTDIESMIDLRKIARENKDYKEADRIRQELLDKGVLIEDKDGRTLWKFK